MPKIEVAHALLGPGQSAVGLAARQSIRRRPPALSRAARTPCKTARASASTARAPMTPTCSICPGPAPTARRRARWRRRKPCPRPKACARIDGAGDAVVGHLRDAVTAPPSRHDVRGHHRDDGVGRRRRRFPDPPKGDAARAAFSVKKACFSLSYAPATRRPSSGSTMSPTALTTASAADGAAAGHGQPAAAQAAFIAYSRARPLPHRRAGAGAHAALGHGRRDAASHAAYPASGPGRTC